VKATQREVDVSPFLQLALISFISDFTNLCFMLSFFDQDKAVILYPNTIQFICSIHTLLHSFYVCF